MVQKDTGHYFRENWRSGYMLPEQIHNNIN
jgi:hypothetical protein